MRLQVTPKLSMRDGSSNRDGRMTNVVKETSNGSDISVLRPGLELNAQASGIGNGLVCYNGNLISVFGASLGYPTVGSSGQVSEDYYNIAGVQLLDMCAFNGGWLCISAGQIHRTTDFVTFTPILTPDVYDLIANTTTIATNGTVALASFYNLDTDATGFLSIDTNYTVTEVSLAYQPDAVMWNGTKFCAMRSSTRSVTSSDGATWTDGVVFTGGLFGPSIAYGGGVFCLVGYSSPANLCYARTSSDGLTWNAAVLIADISSQGFFFTPVCWGGTQFVASGLDWVSTSADGITWSALSYPYPYNFAAKDIAYNGSTDSLLALGKYSVYSDQHTKMLSFDNGDTWLDVDEQSYNGIEYNGCISSGDGFITMGSTVVSGASNNIEVIGSVSSVGGVTEIDSLVNARIDFAQSTL